MSGLASWWDRLPRPLDPFASFKVKMGLVVGGAITLAAFTFWVGASWQFRYALLAALATSLVLTQFLAHGMTSPLRHMAAAARAMARGDYSRRVRATSRDEVGELATAFNQMAADLGAADEYRRGMIANVSHELRTPIAALHAVLENVVDGVAQPDRETMRMALAQTVRLGELVVNLLDLSRLEGGAIPLRLTPSASTSSCTRPLGSSPSRHTASTWWSGCRRPTWSPSPTRLVFGRWWSTSLTTRSGTARQVPGCRYSGRRADPSGLRLEVCDEGPGIPEAERERVFQRFSRGATSAGGTGLGLAIARWASELHGGAIEVIDDPMGCRIGVTIPHHPMIEELA